MRARAFAFAFATLALAACDVPTPSVVVRFAEPASSDAAVRVEVSLLSSCAGQVAGDEAESPLTTIDVTPSRSQPLGTFARGDYGLYARAFDVSCTVFAAGCSDVSVGADDPLEVVVSTLPGAGCGAGERCAPDGRCVPTDGGATP